MAEKPHDNFEEDGDEPTLESLIWGVASEYLGKDDTEFMVELDPEDRLGYVYGRLLENGEDPDEILQQHGIIEGEE
jgi:hypothetical protein